MNTGIVCFISRRKVLVSHENSNIQITGEILQCLKPRAWLNDEVTHFTYPYLHINLLRSFFCEMAYFSGAGHQFVPGTIEGEGKKGAKKILELSFLQYIFL